MALQRVITFVDGLNLYHAIDSLQRQELHWVDLRTLSKVFFNSRFEQLTDVFYFSAYAQHIAENFQKCQKAYLKALELTAVKPVLGHFKEKNRKCPSCTHRWIGHEEKETDVNIALFLLDSAYQNLFDHALVITNDSDLAPAIQITRKRFPEKRITTIAPPNYYHSNELIKVSSDKARIRPEHLERCLLPSIVTDASRLISVSRPVEYLTRAMASSAKR
jgi:uncharacterized LabA/DUF88 family protein